jgi:NADH-quinone oxidoreductase subunit C/D
MRTKESLTELLRLKFGENSFTVQSAKDDILTLWLPLDRLREVLKYLKSEVHDPFQLFYDLTAIDERSRKKDPDYTLPPISPSSIIFFP